MKRIKLILQWCIVGGLISAGTACSPHSDNPKDVPLEETTEPEGRIALSPEQIKTVDIRIDTIALRNMHAVVRANGQLAVPPQNRADVNVLTGGIIKQIFVREGDVVKKGQALARIENPDFIQLQQDYLMAEKSFVFTKEEKQRQQELSDAQAGTGKKLQEVSASFNAGQARIATLRKQLQSFGINPESVAQGNITTTVAVTAPISGSVGHIDVYTGTYASVEKPLMEIIDNSKVHADLIVFEKDLHKGHPGQKVHFVLTNQQNREIVGKIYSINKSFEDDTKGIIVHAVIENPEKEQLIPGMYVTALIDIDNQVVPSVPVDAVVHSEGKDFIYIADTGVSEDQHIVFQRAEVVPGISELGYIQISPVNEIPRGTKIVVKGAFYLLSQEKASGHDDD